ncbi:MAG TPA: hypothetical protein PKD90_05680 [Phnomibacter sp.]|nr:hypothetical protein [Phnomibacter sp.]
MVKEINASVIYKTAALCIVLSNASPDEFEELKAMDEQFYKTHRLSQWRRSMEKADVSKRQNIPGYYQYKYLAV